MRLTVPSNRITYPATFQIFGEFYFNRIWNNKESGFESAPLKVKEYLNLRIKPAHEYIYNEGEVNKIKTEMLKKELKEIEKYSEFSEAVRYTAICKTIASELAADNDEVFAEIIETGGSNRVRVSAEASIRNNLRFSTTSDQGMCFIKREGTKGLEGELIITKHEGLLVLSNGIIKKLLAHGMQTIALLAPKQNISQSQVRVITDVSHNELEDYIKKQIDVDPHQQKSQYAMRKEATEHFKSHNKRVKYRYYNEILRKLSPERKLGRKPKLNH